MLEYEVHAEIARLAQTPAVAAAAADLARVLERLSKRE